MPSFPHPLVCSRPTIITESPVWRIAAIFSPSSSLAPAKWTAPSQSNSGSPGGRSVTGFGITAAFAQGAVTSDRLIVLGNWPNGLDVNPATGKYPER